MEPDRHANCRQFIAELKRGVLMTTAAAHGALDAALRALGDWQDQNIIVQGPQPQLQECLEGGMVLHGQRCPAAGVTKAAQRWFEDPWAEQ